MRVSMRMREWKEKRILVEPILRRVNQLFTNQTNVQYHSLILMHAVVGVMIWEEEGTHVAVIPCQRLASGILTTSMAP
jgi:hypothetical protein